MLRNNVQRLIPEVLHDLFGRGAANAAEHAGGQIPLDPAAGFRRVDFHPGDFELMAIRRMLHPGSIQIQPLALTDLRHDSNRGKPTFSGTHGNYGIPVLVVPVNSFLRYCT